MSNELNQVVRLSQRMRLSLIILGGIWVLVGFAIMLVRLDLYGAGDAWDELCHRPIVWSDDGSFHDAIGDADRFVILHQGHEEGSDDGEVIWETRDPTEIRGVFEAIQFVEGSEKLDHCMCYGYPVLEWYKNGRRLVHVSVQHGKRIRWEEFQTGYHFPGDSYIGDAPLTKESCSKLMKILHGQGVSIEYSR